MSTRQLSILLSIPIMLVGLAISRFGEAQQPAASSPQTLEQAVAADGQTTFKKLAELLTAVGVKADETKLIDGTAVNLVRVVHIRWNAYIGAPDFVERSEERRVGKE